MDLEKERAFLHTPEESSLIDLSRNALQVAFGKKTAEGHLQLTHWAFSSLYL